MSDDCVCVCVCVWAFLFIYFSLSASVLTRSVPYAPHQSPPVCVCVCVCVCAPQTKERYEKSLEELDKVTPPYMENMDQMFEQWQEFEEKRISFFKELLLDVKKHIDLSSNHKWEGTHQQPTHTHYIQHFSQKK